MAFLEPDRYFSRISKIDIRADIIEAGYTHILLDIDNTILTRDTHEVPRDIALWLAQARDAGLIFCLLSNNWHEGVHELAQSLDLPIVSHAVKPLPPAYLIALNKIGAKRKTTLAIGDQLITDVIGAHLLRMKAYLVCPLVEADLKHTLLLRNVERALIGHLQPEGKLSSVCDDGSNTPAGSGSIATATSNDASNAHTNLAAQVSGECVSASSATEDAQPSSSTGGVHPVSSASNINSTPSPQPVTEK